MSESAGISPNKPATTTTSCQGSSLVMRVVSLTMTQRTISRLQDEEPVVTETQEGASDLRRNPEHAGSFL